MFEHQKDNVPSIETLSTESTFSNSSKERQLSMLAISRIPVVLYHRDDGYLCQDPNTAKRDRAAVAFDEKVVPYKRFYMVPMKRKRFHDGDNDSELMLFDNCKIRSKQDFFKELKKLITYRKDGHMTFTVALQDSVTGNYLTSRGGRKASRNKHICTSEFQIKPEFFCLQRNDTGSFSFKTVSDEFNVDTNGENERGLYMYTAHKTESQEMQGSNGEFLSILKNRVRFSDKLDNIHHCNEWTIEPTLLLDSRPVEQQLIQHGSVLFLGIINTHLSLGHDIDASNIDFSWHFHDVPCAWRSTQQLREAIESLCSRQSDCDDGLDYLDNAFRVHLDDNGARFKWTAKRLNSGRLFFIITTSDFRQEVAEECVTRMIQLETPSTPALRKLAFDTQIREAQLAELENDRLAKEREEEVLGQYPHNELEFQHLQDVPISLLHRSGKWLSVTTKYHETKQAFGISKDTVPDLLSVVPINDAEVNAERSISNAMRTRDEYFNQLKDCSIVTLKNIKTEKYLSCRRRDITDLTGKKRNIVEYSETLGDTEKFLIEQSTETGGFTLESCSNRGFYLTVRKRGGLAFKANKSKGKAEWLINPFLPNETYSDEKIIFTGVVNQDKEAIIGRHALNSPAAWRTKKSWDCIVGELLSKMKNGSSTVVSDSDTGHQWFVTKPEEGAELYIAIATGGFPSYYGSKCVMSVESLYKDNQFLRDGVEIDSSIKENDIPVTDNLIGIMRGIETEFTCSEIHELKEEVQKLTEQMRINLLGLQHNFETTDALLLKSDELLKDAQLFDKLSGKLPNGRNRTIFAMSVAVGVAGAITGWCIGGPTLPLLLNYQIMEIMLGSLGGAGVGYLSSSIYTSRFWKRKFVSLGRCINSRKLITSRNRNKSKQRKSHLHATSTEAQKESEEERIIVR